MCAGKELQDERVTNVARTISDSLSMAAQVGRCVLRFFLDL